MKLNFVVTFGVLFFLVGCFESKPDYKAAEDNVNNIDSIVRKIPSISMMDYENMLPVIDRIMKSESNLFLDAIELAEVQPFAKPYLADGKLHFSEYEIIRDEILRIANEHRLETLLSEQKTNATGSAKRAMELAEGA